MFNSLIQNLQRPFGRGNSNQQSSGLNSGQNLDRNDLEEDGFLVVGDTASERTTIEARNFRADCVDAPPNYNQASQNYLPSYQDYCSSGYGPSPSLDVSHFPGIKHGKPVGQGSQLACTGNENSVTPDDHINNFSADKSITALSGIPFELCCGLQTVGFDETRQHLHQLKQFDYSMYVYDFSVERSFLEEHECSCRENN